MANIARTPTEIRYGEIYTAKMSTRVRKTPRGDREESYIPPDPPSQTVKIPTLPTSCFPREVCSTVKTPFYFINYSCTKTRNAPHLAAGEGAYIG